MDEQPRKKRPRKRTQPKEVARMTALRTSMVEALGEVQKQHPSVSVGMIIVATGGPRGKLMCEWGTANRAAVKGVLEAFFDQEFVEEEEEEDDEDDSQDGDTE